MSVCRDDVTRLVALTRAVSTGDCIAIRRGAGGTGAEVAVPPATTTDNGQARVTSSEGMPTVVRYQPFLYSLAVEVQTERRPEQAGFE
jgi:hypothetical protein